MVTLVGDDEIAAAVRHGTGYAAVTVAFSDARYSPQVESALRASLQNAFGPILFSEWADLGTKAIIVFYFDVSQLESPIDVDRVRQLTRESVTTWEDQRAPTTFELDVAARRAEPIHVPPSGIDFE